MAEILELCEKLKNLAEQEREIFRAEKPRQFFIELFTAESIEALVKEFEPDAHNSKAQAEFQKLKESTANIDKYIKNRRAVAYMFSGKQCVRKHYEETELTCQVMGAARMNWVLNELEQLRRTQTEEKPIFTATKG